MTDIEKAKSLLEKSDYTCVLCKNESIYTSQRPGINPMLDFLAEKIELKGFAVADKIVGKAAAMLFILAEVSVVFSEVMSKDAVKVLEKYGIEYSYNILTESIINRMGNGICPMEEAVREISDPQEAEIAIRGKLMQLSRGNTVINNNQ